MRARQGTWRARARRSTTPRLAPVHRRAPRSAVGARGRFKFGCPTQRLASASCSGVVTAAGSEAIWDRLGFGMRLHVAWPLLLSLCESSPARARQLQDACACARCVQNVGDGYCKGAECTIRHCVSSGFDCSCYMPCPCATCVRKGGEQPYCESIWGDCSCLILEGSSGTPPAPPSSDPTDGACGDFNSRTDAINRECCNEPSEDCSTGRPATCNLGCAYVLLPYFKDCADALGDAAASFDDVVQLCHAAGCSVGGFYNTESNSCEPCPVGYFKAEEGLQECTECLGGTTTLGPGSIHPSQCVPPPPPAPPPTTGATTCPPIIEIFTPDDHVEVLRACDVAVQPGATCMVGCDIANGYRSTSGLPGTKYTCGADGRWEGALICR